MDFAYRILAKQPAERGRNRAITSVLISAMLFIYLASGTAHAELKPETKAAYQKYIANLESRLDAQAHSSSEFLWIDRDAARQHTVKSGEISLEHMSTVLLPDGMIQHWIGGMFIPGSTAAQVKHVDQDYAAYATIYAPEITRPNVLSHSGNHYVISYRITKKAILTAVVDTVHVVDYVTLQDGKMLLQSRSESVRQVDDAGTASEQVLTEGEGTGFLWAMNSYWRMQDRDGGVYVECEAVTLSRGIPFGMGKLIEPLLQSFAEDSLKKTLEDKRRAVSALK